jgi:hypothetical protein
MPLSLTFLLVAISWVVPRYTIGVKMKHVYALLIKYIMIVVIIGAVLGSLTDLTFSDILYISLALTIISYIIGDLLILSVTNNTVATIADVILALAVIYLFNFILINDISLGDAFIAALILGVGEWFYHKYVAGKVIPSQIEEE